MGNPKMLQYCLASKETAPVKIDACLKDAIDSLDLSSCDMRYGATALAIALLEKIWRAESMAPGNMERYLSRMECECDGPSEYEDNLRELGYAASALYSTYGLRFFKRLGIGRHIQSYGLAEP